MEEKKNEKRKVPFRKLPFCKVDKALLRFICFFFSQILVHSLTSHGGNRK